MQSRDRAERREEMKAWVLHGINDFRFETVREPAPGEGEVLVAVKASAICGSDIPRIYKTGTYSYPLIPGHEFSGVVVRTGALVSSRWLNKRVGIFPLIPCYRCSLCRRKQYEMCTHYGYLGSRQNGGFAEYAVVPADNLIELPAGISMEAAAMMEPMAVAVHAMRRMRLQKEDKVAVCGLGTIGILLTMFLMEAGIKNVLVIGNKEYQKKTVLEAGVQEGNYCPGRGQDVEKWMIEHTDGHGADVFFECVGKNETLLQAIGATAPAGRICLVGNPLSDMTLEKDVYWKLLRRQLTVTGTWNSSFTHETGDDWHYVLERLARKKIVPEQLITHKLPLGNLVSGLEIMRDKKEDYIKIMTIAGNNY